MAKREVKLPNPEDLVTKCLNFGTTYRHTRKEVGEVVFQCAMCGWEIDQIGALMNVSPDTLKKQYGRAYERGKLILNDRPGLGIRVRSSDPVP